MDVIAGVVLLHFWQRNGTFTEEGIATDSLPLEQQGERVVCYSATATGQAQEHIAPAHRFPYRSIAPKRLGVH
jgi:hypothetical protein